MNGQNANTAPPPLLLRAEQAAKALAISPRLLWTLTNDGTIPCVRIGRTVRYDPNDLTAWIKRQKQRSGGRSNHGQ